jgi:N-acetylmuramoyl-L-alanine amidase
MTSPFIVDDTAPSPQEDAPVGAGSRIVKPGECLSTIAEGCGHFWQTLWNDPANAAVKEARGNPNMLLAGDGLAVPPLRQKTVAVPTGAVHRFRRRGVPAFLHLRLVWGNQPRASEAYVLMVGALRLEGTTSADGRIDVALPRDAYDGTLIIGEAETRQELHLKLGTLPPVGVTAGVERRLANLGFVVDPHAPAAARLRSAVEAFQAQHGMPVDGIISDAFRAKLTEAHGS